MTRSRWIVLLFGLFVSIAPSRVGHAAVGPAQPGAAPARSTRATRVERAEPPVQKRSPDEGVEVGALVSAGFPRPLSVEGFVGADGWLIVGGEYGTLPKITASGVDVTLSAFDADVRLLPFRGPFFVGARVGRQHLAARSTLSTGAGTATLASLDVDTWFINPRAGLLFRFRPGLAVGFDAGLQIPLSSTSSSTATTDIARSTNLSGVADTLGRSVMPTINVLDIGVVF